MIGQQRFEEVDIFSYLGGVLPNDEDIMSHSLKYYFGKSKDGSTPTMTESDHDSGAQSSAEVIDLGDQEVLLSGADQPKLEAVASEPITKKVDIYFLTCDR
uniref:Uncharacterized protein n=1 Tax=Romanomermis culicivorax TaxID=13658 RepID=A0A915L3L4_ROMCU